jgi:hypothetical protein
MARRNAAGRLHSFLLRVQVINPNTNALDAWASVLQLDHLKGDLVRAREVVRLIGELDAQVSLIVTEFVDRGFARDSYVPQLDRVRQIMNPRHINANWLTAATQHINGDSNRDIMPLLQFMAEAWGDTEAEISPDEVGQAWAIYESLQEALENSKEIGPEIRRFLTRQLEMMARALAEYHIRGAAAFREGADRAAVEWAVTIADVASKAKTPDEKEVVQTTAGFWRQAEILGKRAKLVKEIVTLFWNGAIAILSVAHGFGVLPPSVERVVAPYLKSGEAVRGLLPAGSTDVKPSTDGVDSPDLPNNGSQPDLSEPPAPVDTTV